MSYHATATAIGNSKGMRFQAALYQTHPEFASGEFEVDVIAPGRLLIRADAVSADATEDDPVFDTFLAFLEQEMLARPDLMTVLRASDVAHAEALVEGIAVDLDEDFGEDFQLP